MHVGPLGHRLLLNLPVARICSFEAGLPSGQLLICSGMHAQV